MDQHTPHALGLFALDGMQRVHGELELAVHEPLEQEDDGGDDDMGGLGGDDESGNDDGMGGNEQIDDCDKIRNKHGG